MYEKAYHSLGGAQKGFGGRFIISFHAHCLNFPDDHMTIMSILQPKVSPDCPSVALANTAPVLGSRSLHGPKPESTDDDDEADERRSTEQRSIAGASSIISSLESVGDRSIDDLASTWNSLALPGLPAAACMSFRATREPWAS